uniref:BPTI/Kunitz inhibitor domain-containing protein n=1 Tax=Panagrolaimus sp. JU765 TaxID=591449 RepID=A0AC34QJB7_9BILA
MARFLIWSFLILCIIGIVFSLKTSTKEDCKLEVDYGRCKAYIPRFYFDSESKTCKSFGFGGCGGNGNNFNTKEECEKLCLFA